MPTIELNRLTYHYTDTHPGQIGRPTVVLLHGFTGSAATWTDGIGRLSDRYRVIAVDLPGHGETDSPERPVRYAMEDTAADIGLLITRLQLGQVHLLGYSMGGRLALYIAIHYGHQLRSLILESASPGLEHDIDRIERERNDNALADRIENEGIEPFVDFWESIPLWESQADLPETVRADLRAQRLTNNPAGLANSLRGLGTGVQPPLWGLLDRLKIPVHLIVGQFDAKFFRINQTMSNQIEKSTFHLIVNAGHTAHLEQPGPFWKLILRITREVDHPVSDD